MSNNESHLTPKQSADVIRYYYDNANKQARERGWRDKLTLAQAAFQTIIKSHSILPDKKPMLTFQEMEAGKDYIENPPKSDEYYQEADRRVDKRNISYDDAYRELDAEGWE